MSVSKRLLALIMCLLMLFSAVACSSDVEDSSDSGSGASKVETGPSQAPDNYVALAEYEIANFRIVYEKALSSAVTKKITTNLDTLKTKIGVTMEAVDDTTLPAPDSMPEILIG